MPTPDPPRLPRGVTEITGKDQGYHYHQNAGTYMQIGEAMGKGMVELQKNK